MSKHVVTMARKNSMIQHEEESLRGTRLKSTFCFLAKCTMSATAHSGCHYTDIH